MNSGRGKIDVYVLRLCKDKHGSPNGGPSVEDASSKGQACQAVSITAIALLSGAAGI